VEGKDYEKIRLIFKSEIQKQGVFRITKLLNIEEKIEETIKERLENDRNSREIRPSS